MKRTIFIYLLSFSTLLPAFSQNVWDLDTCIDYALKNNLNVKGATAELDAAQLQVGIQKYDIIQSLGAYATQEYRFGKSLDPFTNNFATSKVNANNFYGNLSLNFDLPYWLRHKLAQMKVTSQQVSLDLRKKEIQITTTAYYLQVVLAKEILAIAKKKLAYSEELKRQVEEMERVGERTRSDVLETGAQVAINKSDIVKAENDVKYKTLLLQQFLNYKEAQPLHTVPAENIQMPSQSVLLTQTDISKYPSIVLAEENVNIQKQNLKIQKASILPSLAFGGTFGTGFSSNNARLVNGQLEPYDFREQLDQNLYRSINFSLNIPISPYMGRRKNIRYYQSLVTQSEIEKEKAVNDLENEIEQLRVDVTNSLALYEAYSVSYEANKAAYTFMQDKYKAGRATLTELTQTETNLYQSESDMATYKYQYYYKLKTLNFYSE